MAPHRAALLALALVAMACSGGSGDDDGAAPSSSTTKRTTTTTTIPPTTTTTSPAQAVAAGKCPELPRRARLDPRRPHYILRLDVRPDEGVVDGEETVRFTPDRATDRLVFRLWPNGPRPDRASIRLEPGPVSAGSHPLRTERPDPTTLIVRLGSPLRKGEEIEVSLPWRLTVPGAVPDRVSREGDALRLGSFFPLLAWEPGVGWALEPPVSGFAEATTSPAADFSMSVNVPSGYGVLATGVPDGNGRWRAVGARDVGMSIGRFATVTSVAHAPRPVRVTVGVHAGVAASAQQYADKIVRVLENYSRRYGPYPWPVYSVGITPGLAGGIEYPMHVMQGPGTYGRTLSHEVGHMWFYGLVGNDQGRDPWLDEGLASWAEAREENSLGEFRSKYLGSAARGHAGEPMTYWEQHQDVYYRGVYVQPAVALADLGSPEMVDCALAHYVARNAFRVARPADLFDAVTVVFPDAVQRMAPAGVHP